jgi:phospholipase/carboxylesterase
VSTLDGPRREPRGQPATSLVVILHGYGADGNDLIPLADTLQTHLPATAFVAPNAPEPLPWGDFDGRQWFALQERNALEYVQGADHARPALDVFLDAELKARSLPASRMALVGFSQGTMMALHVGLRRPAAPAAIVGFSGVIAGADRLPTDITCSPPVLLIHGADDGVIPSVACPYTERVLASCGVSVEAEVRPGLDHAIDGPGLAKAGAFLARYLA